jgi:CheY-like chemotaxis protein
MPAYGDVPFDLIEEGKEKLLLLEPLEERREKIRSLLAEGGYHVLAPAEEKEALDQFRFQGCSVILAGERFRPGDAGTPSVLDYLRRLSSGERRKFFVVLLSETLGSMDPMDALRQSVNLVVNYGHLDQLPGILRRARVEHDEYYAVLRESLRRAGRI